MGELEVYTTGGGYYVTQMLNFLAMFTSGSAYQDMLVVGILVGIIYLAIKLAFTGAMTGALQHFAIIAVAGGIMIGPKARVIVLDTTYPLEIYGHVDNVPFAPALVASFTTRTSYAITRRMEALLSTPDNLVYQRSGMLFGATLMAQAARWRAVTPTVQANLTSFMENCVVDGTNIGLMDMDEVTRTGDLASYIGSNVPGSLAYYDETTDTVQRCTDGWAGLELSIGQEITRVLQTKASARSVKSGMSPNIVDVNALTGTLNDFQNLMGMASYDATRYLKQTMLVLALDDAAGRLVANSGNSAAMTLYQTARTEQQTRSSYQVIGSNATKWVPLIKIAFEMMYYGAFPLAVFLMLTPMAATVIRGYFGGFVWLAAWEPLSAILHTALLNASTGWYREHTTTFSGTTTSDVLNWANHFGVQSVEQDVATVAGYLMMSVPFLATTIFFGANRIAGLATSMLNVGQGSAIESGREAATGNVSLGNASMNNMSANKWNTSALFDTGRATTTLGDGTMRTVHRDGSTTFSSGTAQSNTGFSATVGSAVRTEMSRRASEAQSRVEAQSEDFATTLTSASSRVSDFVNSATDSSTAGREGSWNISKQEQANLRDAWQTVESASKEYGLTTEATLSGIMAGRAGVGKGVSANIGMEMGLRGTSLNRFQDLVQASRTGAYDESLSTIESSAERAYSGNSGSEATSQSRALRTSLDDIEQSSVRLTQSYDEAKRFEEAASIAESTDRATQARITDIFQGKLRAEGMNDDDIARILNPKTAAGMKDQQAMVQKYLPSIIDELGLTGSQPRSSVSNDVSTKPAPVSKRSIDSNAALIDVERPQSHSYRDYREETRDVGGDIDRSVSSGVSTGKRNVQSGVSAGQQYANKAHENVAVATGKRLVGFEDQPTMQSSFALTNGYTQNMPQSSVGGGMAGNSNLSAMDRDTVIRTIIGEAANESWQGQAAVAHVIKNRVEDPRFDNNATDVALAEKQFSAWNSGAGGNDLVNKYNPGDAVYEEVGQIVDSVWSGQTADMTGGATHYYSPAGMLHLVETGAQENLVPKWLENENAARGYATVQIGGHIFTGKAQM